MFKSLFAILRTRLINGSTVYGIVTGTGHEVLEMLTMTSYLVQSSAGENGLRDCTHNQHY